MIKKLIVRSVALAVGLALAAPAFAQGVGMNLGAGADVSTGAPGSARMHVGARAGAEASTTFRERMASTSAERMQNIENRGDAAITARIQSLEKLSARIGAMTRLSASQIASLQASLSANISALTSLESTIQGDTSSTSLRADVSSIAKAYRVYLLVIPQAQIAAAADRILAAAGQFENLSTKLSSRIDAAALDSSGVTGINVAALKSALTDMNAKVADAKTQANAAASETVSLKPDNGDATVAASNTAALKDARAKIQAAQQDLKAAQKDALTIIQGVKGKRVSASATTTASATAQ